MYKVVWTDGYNRETVADHLVADNMAYGAAHAYCEWLRRKSDWDGDWWIVLPQAEKLWGGMAEFV